MRLWRTHKNFKSWQKAFIDNLSTSIHLHKIKKLIVINHKDCGAAKLVNEKKQFSEKNEEKIHDMSFQKLKKIINRKFPKLDYEFYLMNLNSSVQKF